MIHWTSVVECVLLLLGAYFVGSISFGHLFGRLKGIDLRQCGSHNIGATNAWRVLGWRWGLSVFILDFLKGFLPMYLVVHRTSADLVDCSLGQMGVLLGVMLALVLGHTFTCFLKFRGGKGVATMAGCLAAAFPVVAGWAVLGWVITLLLTRYVSLSSMVAGVVMVVTSILLYVKADGDLMPVEWMVPGMLGFILLLVVWRHRTNILRILTRTEPKVHLFGR